MSNIKEERRKKEYNDLYKELCRRYDGETADRLRKYHNSVNRQDVCSRSTKPETVTAKRSRSYKNPESAFSKIFSETFLLCFIGFFFIITVGLGALYLTSPDRKYSESENRMLATAPTLTAENLISGKFMKDFETYLADQFPIRDNAISIKTFSDRVLGKRQENNVYIGKNNFLFDSQLEYNEADTKAKTEAIDKFLSERPDLKAMISISPNSSYIYKENLPYSLKLPDQKKDIQSVYGLFKSKNLVKLDVTTALENEKEKGTQLFYKTDHHWTTEGAYCAFENIIKQWGLDAENVIYESLAVTTEFEGTLSGKSGVHDVKDSINIIVPKNSAGTYVVNYESQQRKTTSLFEKNKLNEKNKYEVFLGGNYDKVVISTTSHNENTLLIVKDSFANCMIPMLTPYFSKIVVVDPRYLTDNMDNIASDENYTHMLFLYNLNTFLEDTSIIEVF